MLTPLTNDKPSAYRNLQILRIFGLTFLLMYLY